MTVGTGTRLNDRYRLEELIATGGMGEVWRARDELLDRDVAVKVLKREYAEDATFIERFRAEARHAAGLAHPGIASVFDYGEAEGMSYLVMELVRGDPLSALIATEVRLSPERTLDVVAQAARALEAAHQGGVIHRDVKPGNILVCPDGTVKITDFGIARAADAVPLTKTGTVMGTAHYLSPEQANGGAVTYASDVYSLGVVAYECLSGHRPFDGDTPVAIAMGHLYEDPVALPEDVPETVSGLVARAMAKDPAERFPSAAAFAQAADAVQSGVDAPTQAMATAAGGGGASHTMVLPVLDEPAPEPAGAPRRERRGLLVAALAGVLALVLAAVAWSATRPQPETEVPTVRGVAKAEALKRLEAAKLDAVEKTRFADAKAGVVLTQDPAPGTVLREGDDVTITISKGPQPVTIPEGLSEKGLLDVVQALEKLGLTVRQVGAFGPAPFGTVTAVTPSSGLRRGDTVTVAYSYGPERDRDNGKDGKGDKGDD